MPQDFISLILDNPVILYIILFVIATIAIYICYKVFFKKKLPLYKARTFLTQNEKDCFRHLRKEFPEFNICPQVSMGALLEPNINSKNPTKKERSQYTILRNKIQSKVVDFVMMNNDMEVVFLIELDDRSHDNKVELDALRDKNFSQAGIPTVRFRRNGNSFMSRKEIEQQLENKTKHTHNVNITMMP